MQSIYTLTPEQVKEIKKREAEYLSGNTITYTWKEAKAEIRKQSKSSSKNKQK